MGNQQERPLGIEWAAGLAQGEGSFGFSIHAVRQNKVKLTPFFSLGMKDEAAIDVLAECLRAAGLAVYRPPTSRGQLPKVHVTGVKRLMQYTDMLIPYLVGDKRKSAMLVQKVVNSRLSKPPYSPFSEQEIAWVTELRDHHGGRFTGRVELLRLNAVHGDHQRTKTHCPQGHAYTAENTTHSNTGARRCVICDRAAKRRHYDRKRNPQRLDA